MREVRDIEWQVRVLGGLARTYELYDAGYWQSMVQLHAGYKKILHVRKGWWATKDTPPDVIAARKAGGRLACVSALQYHGIGKGDDLLHVALERSSRHPHDPGVVAHWSRRTLAGTRAAVSVEVAVEQARRCRALVGRPQPEHQP